MRMFVRPPVRAASLARPFCVWRENGRPTPACRFGRRQNVTFVEFWHWDVPPGFIGSQGMKNHLWQFFANPWNDGFRAGNQGKHWKLPWNLPWKLENE
jgi:hypothetical protein